MEMIYLDYNATTPLEPLVIEAIRPYLEQHFGNPSSMHSFGIQAKIAIEKARLQLASLLNCHSDEIVFTSGGTESNNFALKGAAFANRGKGNHIITSAIEHPAVTEVCRYLENNGYRITWLPVDDTGIVNPADVESAITPQTILISVMHANNETGSIQPLSEIGNIARARGVLFHTDAAQSVGKIPVDVVKMKADMLSVAGHKLYAPKGVGALFIRRGVLLQKLIHGADHESNLRAGTENVMEVVGLGKAAEIAKQRLGNASDYGLGISDGAPHIPNALTIIELRDLLHDGIRREIPGVRLNGHLVKRLPNTLSLGFPGIEAALLLGQMKGVAASAGAACHTDSNDISGVLSAMHVPNEYAIGTIRFSIGRMTTREEIERAIPIVAEAYRNLRGESVLPFTGDDLRNTSSEIRLTEYTHALGCACKIRPQILEKILKCIPGKNDPAILVGHETSDDAAVFMIDENTAIVQTVDFIPPVVDDPYMYGAIAAANALSDVYAMGSKPLFALSIVGFPDRKLPIDVLHNILKGANDKVAEAGIQVVGGHSIEDGELKFGLVVTGLIHPDKILRNSTAMPGDALILTKPVGTGIITTAIKQGLADSESVDMVNLTMAELNKIPAEIMAGFQINSCTDISGFGFLGHLKEMVCGSKVHAVLQPEMIPIIESAWRYAAAGAIPGGTKNNLDYVKDIVQWNGSTPELMKYILADAQTSGGLLISLPGSQARLLIDQLHEAGILAATIIGEIISGKPGISV